MKQTIKAIWLDIYKKKFHATHNMLIHLAKLAGYVKVKDPMKAVQCGTCGKVFHSKQGLIWHTNKKHSTTSNMTVVTPEIKKEYLQYIIQQELEGVDVQDDQKAKLIHVVRNWVKQHNKKAKTPQEEIAALQRENQRLMKELIIQKMHRNEEFYQVIVEKWLGGSHHTLQIGAPAVDTISTYPCDFMEMFLF
jgi:uncharacterized C2H2 Zn-finger protein